MPKFTVRAMVMADSNHVMRPRVTSAREVIEMRMHTLTEEQSKQLVDELSAIAVTPQDEPHIVFRLAFDAVRRRQMRDAGEGAAPSMEEAIREATEIVQADFEGFQPRIGEGEQAVPETEKSQAISRMIVTISELDPTDATRLRWLLLPEDRKQELREKYDREWSEDKAREVIDKFREEVLELHNRRAPQQEQYRELGQDAIE